MDRFAVRRRLLQGSLSAPLVLTVASASAQSRTTFLACIGRDGVVGDAYVDVEDGLYRVPVPTYRFVSSSGDPIPGPFVEEGGSYFLLSTLAEFPVPLGYSPEALPGGSAWQLVYFDGDGNPVEYGFNNTNSGTAVTRSCHTSFVVRP